MSKEQQPEALRLADALRDGNYSLYQEHAATEAELRRLHARVQELEAAQKGDYLDGVNIPRLREALTFLGRGNGIGEGEVANKLSEYVNSIARAVLACKDLLRSGVPSAPWQRAPLTDEQWTKIWAEWFDSDQDAEDLIRAIERAHGIGKEQP